MTSTKSVTVLTPNGRRPTVKITPNTTILQVLEEACKKHDFNPDEYDLKHYKRILDVNLIFRYANISNNACLEMVKCKSPRKISNITVCIQLENGNRLTSEFSPLESIEKILEKLQVEYVHETAVLIYTQREISAKEFQTVTLRSLGLGSGTALFRLLKRDPEKLKEQAHVYIPSQPKIIKIENKDNETCTKTINSIKEKISDPISTTQVHENRIENTYNLNDEIKTKKEEIKDQDLTELSNQKEEKITSMEVNYYQGESHQNIKHEVEQEPQVEFLGERSALLFNQAGAKAMQQDDIPDNFFELTINDAKALLRDVKQLQTKLADSPLLTSAQRDLDKDKTLLNRLHKYQRAIIRIQFPNQLVLQGLFGPLETVQAVKEFVQTYLENPQTDFALYTAPPRCDLNANERLLDRDLVPTAIIYYSGSSGLKPEIQSKLTDPSAASFHASKTRLSTMRNDDKIVDEDVQDNVHLSSSTPAVSSISRNPNNGWKEPQPGSSRVQPQKSQAPKWFKPSTK